MSRPSRADLERELETLRRKLGSPGPGAGASSSPATDVEQARAVVEAAPTGMVMVDASGRIQFVNRQAEAMFGYTREECLGRPVELFVPDDLHRSHVEARQAYARSPVARDMGAGRDLKGRRKDGSTFPVEIGLSPVAIGGQAFVVAAVVDITERQSLEQALAQSAELYRSLFETVADPLFVAGPDGRVVICNEEWCRLAGRNRDAIVGSSFEEGLPGALGRALRREFDRAGGGRSPSRFETSHEVGGDQWILLWRISPVLGGADRLERLTVTGRDVTRERQETAHHLHRHKMAALGLMASGIAHEVSNPLASICSMAEEVLDVVEDEQARGWMTRIIHQTQRAARTLRQMLDYARPQVPREGITDVPSMLRSTLDIASFDPRSRRIEVTLEVQPGAASAVIAPDRLSQVILNLLLNAFDAIGERPGRVVVLARRVEGDVAIDVTDDGPGIPAEVAPRLFEPFFSTKGEGTGLGLFVCRQIIQEDGGRLTFEGRSGQAGTTFRVLLPAPGPGQPPPEKS